MCVYYVYMCIYMYIFVCVCVCVYIYIYVTNLAQEATLATKQTYNT